MSEPTVHVLGVYRTPVTEELFQTQMGTLYGSDLRGKARREAERECRDQLASTVLVEVMVRNRDARFQMKDFSQPQDGVPQDNWQVAWAEAFLSVDGQSLLVERWREPPEAEDFRVAFFIHFWDPVKPLFSSYGELACPPVQEMPERLRRLVPYEPVD